MEQKSKLAQAILRMMLTNAEEQEELKKILGGDSDPVAEVEEGEKNVQNGIN